MDDRGRSVSVLVSQVDSVSLVQLSKYRGSRASVLLPPQPIALHRSAFSSRLGRFERDGRNEADFIFINELLNPCAALNLYHISNNANGTYRTEGEPSSDSSKNTAVHPVSIAASSDNQVT